MAEANQASKPKRAANQALVDAGDSGGGTQTRFAGGYTVPPGETRPARTRVGRDLGEIRIEQGVLTLRPVRQPPGRFVAEVHLAPDDVELVAPIQLDYVGANRGVAVRLVDGVDAYLWTDQPAEVLARLVEQGFTLSPDPVVARGIVG